MKLKIVKNPNNEKYELETKLVKDNDGYCPCRIEKIPDNKCLCKEFRDQDCPGLCLCQRYMKVEIEE